MPFPIYENVIDLVVCLSIRRGPGLFMNVSVWNIMLLQLDFLMWQSLLF